MILIGSEMLGLTKYLTIDHNFIYENYMYYQDNVYWVIHLVHTQNFPKS